LRLLPKSSFIYSGPIQAQSMLMVREQAPASDDGG
jgi:hypothetical protein